MVLLELVEIPVISCSRVVICRIASFGSQISVIMGAASGPSSGQSLSGQASSGSSSRQSGGQSVPGSAPAVRPNQCSPPHSALSSRHSGRCHRPAFWLAQQHSRPFSRYRRRRCGGGARGRTSDRRVGCRRIAAAQYRPCPPDQSSGAASQPVALRLRISGTLPRPALHDPALGRNHPSRTVCRPNPRRSVPRWQNRLLRRRPDSSRHFRAELAARARISPAAAPAPVADPGIVRGGQHRVGLAMASRMAATGSPDGTKGRARASHRPREFRPT